MADDTGQPRATETLPTLVITVRADMKAVEVRGPLANIELCWRMVTDAAKVILDYQGETRNIIVPRPVVPGELVKA